VEAWLGQPVPAIPDDREQVADPRTAYQVVSMLQGVVERGTGRRISEIGKPLAGKTGTTNDSFDTWFIGFTPDLAVGVFIGFDEPKSLGPKETGSSVSAPVFKEFMQAALANEPAIPFRIPPGLSLVRVDPATGLPARAGDSKTILEAFLPGTVPSGEQAVIDGGSGGAPSGGVSPAASGGVSRGTPSRNSVIDSGLY
jgi:penicillin-binding protein 1A